MKTKKWMAAGLSAVLAVSMFSGCGNSSEVDVGTMTSEEIANKIISYGIGMAPNTKVNYMSLIDKVDAPEAKLLVSACQLCMEADYQALGLGNQFGDFEGEIQAKYAGLKDGSKTVDNVVSELDAVIAAS